MESSKRNSPIACSQNLLSLHSLKVTNHPSIEPFQYHYSILTVYRKHQLYLSPGLFFFPVRRKQSLGAMNRCLFLVCVALAMQQCWARHIRKLDGEEVKSEIGASTQPWLLPVFPNKVPSKHLPVLLQNSSVESSQHTDKDDRSKLIPKHLWIALRHKDDE